MDVWSAARNYFWRKLVHLNRGDPDLPVPFQASNPYKRWREIIEDYTRRRLTNEMDCLPGLSGLASEFSVAMRDTFLAGLWRKELLCGSMWILYVGSDPEEGVISIAPPAMCRAPSWCWASINGPICMASRSEFLRDLREAYEYAEIVDVKVEPVVSSDPFGQVQAGYLILRARFWPIEDPLEDHPAYSASALLAVHRFLQKSIQENEQIKQEFHQQHQPSNGQRFALLQLVERNRSKPDSSAEYLVLENIHLALVDEDLYFMKTIGFSSLKRMTRELQAATVKKKTVKIV